VKKKRYAAGSEKEENFKTFFNAFHEYLNQLWKRDEKVTSQTKSLRVSNFKPME
jgi:hypothetical protein